MAKDNLNDLILSGNEIISVPTNELRDAAEVANKSIVTMKQQMQELNKVIEGTRYYWIGRAGDQNRKMYAECEKAQQEFMKHLEVYPAKLLEIAGIMRAADDKGVEMANGLPINIFN